MHAIDWNETFIHCIGGFHLCTAAFAIATRKFFYVQSFMFLALRK